MSQNLASHQSVVAAVQAAEDLYRRASWSESLEAYVEILRGRLDVLRGQGSATVSLRAVDLVVIERVADLAVLFGYLRAADLLLEAYVELTSIAGNRMVADYAALKRVRLTLGQGRLNEAVDRFAEMKESIGDIHQIEFQANALKRWEASRRWRFLDPDDQDVLYTRLYLELGRLMAFVGQYDDALAAIARGLDHAGPSTHELARRAVIPLKLDEIAARLERGDLAMARSDLDTLTTLPGFSQQPDASIRAAELSGKLAMMRGELGNARHQFSWVVETCRSRGFARSAMIATMNLAHALIYLNQTAAARKLLEQATQEATDLGDCRSAARADYLIGLARARGTSLADGVEIAPPVTQLWRPGRTRTRFKEFAPRNLPPNDAPQSQNYLAFFEDEALGFHACLATEGPKSAANRLEQIRSVFAQTDSRVIQVRLQALEGVSAYYLGKYERAAGLLEVAAQGLDTLGLRPELWQTLRVLGWSRKRLLAPADEIESLTERTQSLLDGMVDSLPAEDRPVLLLNKWTTEEEYLAAKIDALVRERERVESSPLPFRLWRRWKLENRLDELLRFLDRHRVVLHQKNLKVRRPSDDESRPVARPLWQRLLTFPRRRATLSFVVFPDRVFVSCVHRGSLDFGVCPVTRLEVREKVRRWHEELGRTEGAGRDPIESAANELAEALQIPALLDKLPRRIRALTIVPDDSLHGLPFAALSHKGRFLVERFAISIGFERALPSARPHLPKKTNEAILVGVSNGAEEIPKLEGVKPELDAIGRWLASRRARTTRLEDETANKATVLEALNRCWFAHIACHGIFEVDRPDHSGLVLIPSQDRVEILTLSELARVDLSNLRLITLSSCWSADNFVLPSRWIISLPETLRRAGAGSILGSLWPVDDRIAMLLMEHFYNNLNSHPRDEALRRAQLECLPGGAIASVEPFASHPEAWAGFTLSGEPGRLRV